MRNMTLLVSCIAMSLTSLAGCGTEEPVEQTANPRNNGPINDNTDRWKVVDQQLTFISNPTPVNRSALIEELRELGNPAEAEKLEELTGSFPCWTDERKLSGYNIFHEVMWEFYMRVRWCTDGKTITYTEHSDWPNVIGFLWAFDGSKTARWSRGGKGSAYWDDFATGYFQICVAPGHIGCVQQSTATINASVRAGYSADIAWTGY